jgi:hypothetical protein
MSLPATNSNAPTPIARTPQRGFVHAVRWALAGALCAGGAWFCAAFAGLSLLDAYPIRFGPNHIPLAHTSLAMAVCGALSGLLAGIAIDLRPSRTSRVPLRTLGVIVLLAGTASGLTIPTLFVCSKSLHPLVSSTLLWVIAGALAGLCGYAQCEQETRSAPRPQFRLHTALLWALAGAACAGGAWAVVVFDATFLPDDLPNAAVRYMLIHGGLGAGYGLVVGLVVGFLRGKEKPVTTGLVLGFGSAFFGALGGSLSVFAVAQTSPHVHPVVSSSLTWSAIGFAMGLCGYLWPHSTSKRVEPLEEDEGETQPEGKTIQWLLHERKRRWRTRALIHVLPVLIVSVGSLVVAVIYASSELSIAFLAVGVLGLSITLVLHNQDTRLRALEQRFQQKRDSELRM